MKLAKERMEMRPAQALQIGAAKEAIHQPALAAPDRPPQVEAARRLPE